MIKDQVITVKFEQEMLLLEDDFVRDMDIFLQEMHNRDGTNWRFLVVSNCLEFIGDYASEHALAFKLKFNT